MKAKHSRVYQGKPTRRATAKPRGSLDPARAQKRARGLLMAFHERTGSWAIMEKDLGINRGFLHAVAHGQKRAPPSLLRKLGLPAPEIISLSVQRDRNGRFRRGDVDLVERGKT